jgi:CRP/FNR family transcriptional regulator, dissimilatory nitrate respiration regulator
LTNPVNIPACLAHLPLFCELSPEEIAHVAQGTRELHLARGYVLFQRGDLPTGFYAVVHGQVKLTLTSPQGIEKVLQIFGPSQSFGEAVMFLGKPYPVYAQALTDCLALHISKNVLLDGIDTDPAFCRKMLAGLSIRLHHLIQNLESLSLHSSAERVIGYLLQDLEEVKDGQAMYISLTVNKNVIASHLNLTPETFSRILHNLSDAGLITVEGKTICIKNISQLRAYNE